MVQHLEAVPCGSSKAGQKKKRKSPQTLLSLILRIIVLWCYYFFFARGIYKETAISAISSIGSCLVYCFGLEDLIFCSFLYVCVCALCWTDWVFCLTLWRPLYGLSVCVLIYYRLFKMLFDLKHLLWPLFQFYLSLS